MVSRDVQPPQAPLGCFQDQSGVSCYSPGPPPSSVERAIAVRRPGAKSCPRYRSAMARTRTRKIGGADGRGATFTHPVTGTKTHVTTPKGTISEAKLVRAFQKGFTVLPDGRIRYSSKSVQEVLKPYSEQLAQAASLERQRCEVPWRRWKEKELMGNDEWIRFRKTLRALTSTIFTSASSQST